MIKNHKFSCTFCYAFPSVDKTAGLRANNRSDKRYVKMWSALYTLCVKNKAWWKLVISFSLSDKNIFQFFFDQGPKRKLVCSMSNILCSCFSTKRNQQLLGWFSSHTTVVCFVLVIQRDKLGIKMQDSVMTYSFSRGVFVVPTQEHLKDKTHVDINHINYVNCLESLQALVQKIKFSQGVTQCYGSFVVPWEENRC